MKTLEKLINDAPHKLGHVVVEDEDADGMKDMMDLLQTQINEDAVKWWESNNPPSLESIKDWFTTFEECYKLENSKDFLTFEYIMPREPYPVTCADNKGYVTGVPMYMTSEEIRKTYRVESPY